MLLRLLRNLKYIYPDTRNASSIPYVASGNDTSIKIKTTKQSNMDMVLGIHELINCAIFIYWNKTHQ